MVFFQAALLAGYAYAHAERRAGSARRRQVALHLGLLALAATACRSASARAGQPPVEGYAGALADRPARLVRSACRSSPSRRPRRCCSSGSRRAATRPAAIPTSCTARATSAAWRRCSAIRCCSSRRSTLAEQSRAWALGYAAAGAAGRRPAAWWPGGGRPRDAVGTIRCAGEAGDRLAPRLRWLALAAVPSALLLAVTAHITTDLAAVPLLWVIPLAPLSARPSS